MTHETGSGRRSRAVPVGDAVTGERYAHLFAAESREHLSVANDALLRLERGAAAEEPVRELFRAVHTVKGMAGAMGFAAVAELAHALESLLEGVRAGRRALDAAVLAALFAAVDALEETVAAAIDGRDGAVDTAAVLERVLAVTGDVPADATAGVLVRVVQTPDSTLPGARAAIALRRAESIGTVADVRPPRAELEAATRAQTFTFRLATGASVDEIARVVRAAGDVASVDVELADAPATVHADAPRRTAPRASVPVVAPATNERAPVRSVRVDARRLDALLDLAGELVIARGRLLDAAGPHADPALRDAVGQMARLVGTLQDEVLSSRLVPVRQVFDRFPRLVRDAAASLGKDVAFEIDGQDLELDRSLLDEIGEPVMHLLRNALDHGLESADERQATGKPATGRLTLSASRDRDAVLLRVADDGRGVDRARVVRRARELGLLGATDEPSDEAIVRLIARPGFSTADRVSELSGRGVGVDAVQARLRALGGSVDIRSRPGEGTTVTLRLPLTLAIVGTLLARVGDEVYALPASHVTATAELDAATPATVRGEAVLRLGDEVLPARDLRAAVGLPPSDAPGRELVVLETDAARYALAVDELLGEQEAVVKRFTATHATSACFSGATILGNGTPALIVDVGRLLS